MALSVSVLSAGISMLWPLVFTWVTTVFAFIAEMELPEEDQVVEPRYTKVSLLSGIGWGSPAEELRAHLLGVWEPRYVHGVGGQTTHSPSVSYERWGYVALAAAAASAWIWLPLSGLFLAAAGVVQVRETRCWYMWSPMLANSILTLGVLSWFDHRMLVLVPVVAIYARKSD